VKPYYEDERATIYHGDCREILPQLEPADAVITDPVWPNAKVPMFGQKDPLAMFGAMWEALPGLPKRAAIQLGCDSDPRFLAAVPVGLPFFRVAWLEVVRMSYKGRLGMTGDVGYLFGAPPKSRKGQHIIPGRCTDPSPKGRETDHPCPRKLRHVEWLVRWWTETTDLVLDPFMGSGTTLLAVANLFRREAIGIEISEEYCEMAADRLRRAQINMELEA
jgi:site-specific DNA-methyltransferase (adenine-specific)